MDIKEIRRKNLRFWVNQHGTPTAEKSYFSQLFSGASPFGEKAARRLEEKYKMGDGYLDGAQGEITQTSADDLANAIKLLELYRSASDVGRKFIMGAALAAEKSPGQPL